MIRKAIAELDALRSRVVKPSDMSLKELIEEGRITDEDFCLAVEQMALLQVFEESYSQVRVMEAVALWQKTII